jgi:predicted secreted hydrolase
VFLLYGGTGEGLAAATMAAVVLSICISFARKWYGYYEYSNGEWWYVIGKLNMSDAIIAEKRRKCGNA